MEMRTIVFAGMIAALATNAQARAYDFSFVADLGNANYGDFTASGTFTTGGSTLPAAITNITGSVHADPTTSIIGGAITALSPYADSDNVLYSTTAPGQVSIGGVSFTDAGGQSFNLYSWNGGDSALASVVDSVGYPQNGVAGTLTVTAVPELSTWTMLLAGFGALGFGGYRARKNAVAA